MLNNLISLYTGGAAAAAATSYESIATVTVGAGGSSSISFSSIPSTYKHLQIRYIARGTNASENNFFMQFNSDTSGNYAGHLLYGDGSSAVAGGYSSGTYMTYFSIANSSRAANTFSAGVIDLLDYANTSKNKTVRMLSGREDNSAGIVILSSGLWNSTSAVSNINIYTTNNVAQYSQFALYGVKG